MGQHDHELKSEPERLLHDVQPPAEMVERVTKAALVQREDLPSGVPGRRLLLAFVGLVAVAAPVVWLSTRPQATPAAVARSTPSRAQYEISNRDGLVVLRSVSGEVLVMAGN